MKTNGHSENKIHRSLLIIDDEKNILNAIKRTLQKEPYKQLYAQSGKEALEILKKEPVGVVLCDLGMPDMDGKKLLSLINENYPHIIRLIISGKRDVDEILDAINAGYIFRYIVKPWNNEELKIMIRQAFYLYDLEQEKKNLMNQLEEHNLRLEKEVAVRTNQLIAAEKCAEIGKFTAQIVHNLNNPLSAVLGFLSLSTNLMQNEEPDLSTVSEYIEDAKSHTLELADIVSGIMQHVRNEKIFLKQNIDVNSLIRKEVKLFDINPFFKNKIKTKLFLNDALPQINGNPIQIKQVIDNVMKNAIDAMENVEKRVLEIRTDTNKGYIAIAISDTGEGISIENLPNIFSADFTTKPIGKGTGLGLASVKQMVESYQGSIQVESQKDHGTTFTIKLPVTNHPEVGRLSPESVLHGK